MLFESSSENRKSWGGRQMIRQCTDIQRRRLTAELNPGQSFDTDSCRQRLHVYEKYNIRLHWEAIYNQHTRTISDTGRLFTINAHVRAS